MTFKNKNVCLYALVPFFSFALSASEKNFWAHRWLRTFQGPTQAQEDATKPPIFPVAQTVVPDVWVPESSYYHAKADDRSAIFMGPCSPCVCAQICDSNSCLYVHQRHDNAIEEPLKKVYQHLPLSEGQDKHDLDVTVFTHIDTPEKKDVFREGSHKKRIERFMEQLQTNAHIAAQQIHYTESSPEESARTGYADSFVVFKDRKPHRINIKKQNYVKDVLDPQKNPLMDEYLTGMLKQSGTGTEVSRYDNPLSHIARPNVNEIVPKHRTSEIAHYAQDIVKGRPF